MAKKIVKKSKKVSAGRGKLTKPGLRKPGKPGLRKPGLRKPSTKKHVMKKKVIKRDCEVCGKPIPAIRLELLPDTTYCVKCSAEHAPVRVYDPEEICAKSSLSCANGFAPSD